LNDTAIFEPPLQTLFLVQANASAFRQSQARCAKVDLRPRFNDVKTKALIGLGKSRKYRK
jgi:hypothetical protein